MANDLVLPAMPAHLLARAEQAQARNAAAMGGIRLGGFPRISQGGAKFHIIEGDQKTLITDAGGELPAMELQVIVVGFNPMISKTYYAGKWEAGDNDEPDCSADNGTVPDAGVPHPQSASCANCPQNVWGSKISEQGKQIKACSDNKRLVIVGAQDMKGGPAIALTITPGALKPWAEYVRDLNQQQIEISSVVTKVQFDPTVTFPKLQFKFGRYLTAEEQAIIDVRAAGDDVRMIASPKGTPHIVVHPVGEAARVVQPAVQSAPPAAPVVQPAVQAPEPTPWTVGLADPIIAAINAVGGPESAPGAALLAQFKPAAAPAPEPEPEPAPDPYAGLPAHVKPAVEAAGGLGTASGDAVYGALTGTAAPVASAQTASTPEGGKRKRRTKAEMQADAAAAGAPAPTAAAGSLAPAAKSSAASGFGGGTPPAPAAAPAPSLATAPAANLGADIDALLAKAMATPSGAAVSL